MIETTNIDLSEIRAVRSRLPIGGYGGRFVDVVALYWRDYKHVMNFPERRLNDFIKAIELHNIIDGKAEFVISDTAPRYKAGSVHNRDGRMGLYVKKEEDGSSPDITLFWDILGKINRGEIE